MTEKSPDKRKRLIRADLNFVSQHPLEHIARELEQLRQPHSLTTSLADLP